MKTGNFVLLFGLLWTVCFFFMVATMSALGAPETEITFYVILGVSIVASMIAAGVVALAVNAEVYGSHKE